MTEELTDRTEPLLMELGVWFLNRSDHYHVYHLHVRAVYSLDISLFICVYIYTYIVRVNRIKTKHISETFAVSVGPEQTSQIPCFLPPEGEYFQII